MPGDDIRGIDWKLFARTDRYFVKQFEAETNTNFMVLLDVSPSMRYRGVTEGPGSVSKLDYGCFLAAALCYFSSMQRDRVGLATFDEDVIEYVPPSSKHLRVSPCMRSIAHSAERTGAGRTHTWRISVFPAARRCRRRETSPESLRRRSIVLLISDLYEEPDAVLAALSNVRGRGNDMIVFHLLDRNEIEFPFADATNFVDLETGEKMPVIPEYLRTQYREVVADHTATLARRLQEQRRRRSIARFDTEIEARSIKLAA